ncbi:nuclear transport factor 2 family protein [Nocardia miyunensis]|uniref:nuclear transport factor 2 family protein n=1 Tax=Nocardia miyunensis TaxID=282684 RepID=UPI00082B0F57|nr:nuclear transport factor 2 family protein [Nocardia miyunensis]
MAEAGLTLGDRRAIDDLLSEYALRLDVDDVEGAAALFTEDGEFETYGRVFAGRDRILRMFVAAPKGVHLAGRSTVAPSSGGADVRMQLVFFPADSAPRRLAVYDVGVLRAGDGGWVIRRMRCRFMNAEGILGPKP